MTGLEVSFGWRAQVARRDIQPRETTMSPQRQQMIQAMTLAGLSAGTQAAYLRAVWHLAKYYRRAPDQLSEEEVRAYLLDLRQRGVARGTFQIARFGLQFFFCHTLGRTWELFGGKKDRLAPAEAAA
jgi:hypothetical protein